MGKAIAKYFALLVIFIASVVLLSEFTNVQSNDRKVSMSHASMPVIYTRYNDEYINELHGYSTQMNAISMRDTIIPLGDDGNINMAIDKHGFDLKEITYQVRSLDGSRLIQDSKAELMQGELTSLLKI